jgi:hypothetical protein
MNFLDMKTVVFTGLIIDIVCTLVMVAMWRQTRHQFNGLGLWALDFSLQTAGLLLIFLRGIIPFWISGFLANILIVSGAWLGLRGLEQFTGRKGPWLPTAFFLAVALSWSTSTFRSSTPTSPCAPSISPWPCCSSLSNARG